MTQSFISNFFARDNETRMACGISSEHEGDVLQIYKFTGQLYILRLHIQPMVQKEH